MTSAFAPDGSEAMGRVIERRKLRPNSICVSDFYELDRVAGFCAGIEGDVTLQLNDALLPDAAKILKELKKRVGSESYARFCVLADSTFGDGDVDEVSALHLNCQALVYFGDANFKTITNIPSLIVSLDTITKSSFAASLDELHSKYSDALFLVENKKMSEAVSEKIGNVSLMTLANDINELSRKISLETVVYIGNTKSPKISAWCLQNQPKMFISVSSDTFVTEVNPVDVGRILMQRFYLIEKAKDAERVGIVLGSNGGHATSGLCMDKLRKLGQESGKTVYSLIVGEPTPQKLANFPEMDIFVLIASPEESILPAKGFYKPVLHPWEFMMACSDEDWTGAYSANWTDLLQAELKASVKEYDVSLFTGNIRTANKNSPVESSSGASGMQLATIGEREIALLDSHKIRESREYFGLNQEQNLAPSKVVDGRSGIAQGYADEK
ncbi:unnamed protein product [Oikopleura dioica]|uniref:Uncharacterized protein n=1 Tax=Oikopleura dioica TaxID=34765 RepID=E4X973_OIKDI|nr:unnamed protein product [Oikopleura dioica]